MDKKSASSPPSMPSTSAHYQTPVPGPTTAQMIEGNVYNIIDLFYSTTSSFGLKWCLECKLHLSTRIHTYTAKYVSQCNVSFFLQIFLVLDHKKLFSRSITAKIIRSTLSIHLLYRRITCGKYASNGTNLWTSKSELNFSCERTAYPRQCALLRVSWTKQDRGLKKNSQ